MVCRKFLPFARNTNEIQRRYFASHSLTAFLQACQEKVCVCVCFFLHSIIRHSFILSFFLSIHLFILLGFVGWYYRHAQWPKIVVLVAEENDGYFIFLIDFDRGTNKFLHPVRGSQVAGALNCHSGEMPAVLQWLQR